jgi:hypothetical protein
MPPGMCAGKLSAAATIIGIAAMLDGNTATGRNGDVDNL